MGLILCVTLGTNFLIRATAFQECGWSPTWTLTEDFALGMELKKRHWQCRYMREYLAVGEAPEQVRNCFQQKSRWCKVCTAPAARLPHSDCCLSASVSFEYHSGCVGKAINNCFIVVGSDVCGMHCVSNYQGLVYPCKNSNNTDAVP